MTGAGVGRDQLRAWAGFASGGIMAALLALVCTGAPLAAQPVTVFAAASLKTALDDIATAYTAETGAAVTLSFAGSSALARQIQLGAPADIFISANEAWMDVLEDEGLLAPGSRLDLVGNRLVLIGHGDRPAMPLDQALAWDARIAMALVDAVPAGIYGKVALQSLGLWDAAAPRVVQADNVRAALAFVALGEAPLGIVYATDAGVEPGVSVLDVFPETSHPPIRYPAALLSDAGAGAADFLAYLQGDAAGAVFDRLGFSRPGD